METSYSKKRGLTLFEVILYIALFAVLIGGAVLSAFEMLESRSRSRAQTTIEEEGTFLLSKIQWALSGADRINLPSLGATSTLLSVMLKNITSSNPVVFSVSRSNLTLSKAGGVASVLNGSRVSIRSLVFSHTKSSRVEPESVTASFTVSSRSDTGGEVTQDFSSTHYFMK